MSVCTNKNPVGNKAKKKRTKWSKNNNCSEDKQHKKKRILQSLCNCSFFLSLSLFSFFSNFSGWMRMCRFFCCFVLFCQETNDSQFHPFFFFDSNCHFQEHTIQVDFHELVFKICAALCTTHRVGLVFLSRDHKIKIKQPQRQAAERKKKKNRDEMRFLIVSFILPIGLKNKKKRFEDSAMAHKTETEQNKTEQM